MAEVGKRLAEGVEIVVPRPLFLCGPPAGARAPYRSGTVVVILPPFTLS